MNNIHAKPKKKLKSLIIPRNINVLISSMGGVGTTFFIKHIKRHTTTNDILNSDGFKHLPFPPFSSNKNIKYIYIYGNPIDSVISLFRRNHQVAQSRKLLLFNNKLNCIKRDTTLEQYAAEGVDRFLFSNQFINWFKGPHFYPTLFVKYEKLWENLETIYDFLEIPLKEIKSFPAKKQRSADLSSLDKVTQDSLNKMYGDFKNYIDKTDDCFIINDRKKRLVPGMFFTKSFYYTARRNFAIKISNLSPSLSDYFEYLYFSGRK